MSIWKKKSITQLLSEASESEKGMKRTLTAWSLVALGIGAIIGAGLFVRTATAAAQNAGPSVTIGFIVAAIGCALAGLCYAELSSSIPISGSAYTYTYATMGELLAWIIGWDLILEYAVGAATSVNTIRRTGNLKFITAAGCITCTNTGIACRGININASGIVGG